MFKISFLKICKFWFHNSLNRDQNSMIKEINNYNRFYPIYSNKYQLLSSTNHSFSLLPLFSQQYYIDLSISMNRPQFYQILSPLVTLLSNTIVRTHIDNMNSDQTSSILLVCNNQIL